MQENESEYESGGDFLKASGRSPKFDSFDENPDYLKSLPRDELKLFEDFERAVLQFAQKVKANKAVSKRRELLQDSEVTTATEFAEVRSLGRSIPGEIRNRLLQALQAEHPDLPIAGLLPERGK